MQQLTEIQKGSSWITRGGAFLAAGNSSIQIDEKGDVFHETNGKIHREWVGSGVASLAISKQSGVLELLLSTGERVPLSDAPGQVFRLYPEGHAWLLPSAKATRPVFALTTSADDASEMLVDRHHIGRGEFMLSPKLLVSFGLTMTGHLDLTIDGRRVVRIQSLRPESKMFFMKIDRDNGSLCLYNNDNQPIQKNVRIDGGNRLIEAKFGKGADRLVLTEEGGGDAILVDAKGNVVFSFKKFASDTLARSGGGNKPIGLEKFTMGCPMSANRLTTTDLHNRRSRLLPNVISDSSKYNPEGDIYANYYNDMGTASFLTPGQSSRPSIDQTPSGHVMSRNNPSGWVTASGHKVRNSYARDGFPSTTGIPNDVIEGDAAGMHILKFNDMPDYGVHSDKPALTSLSNMYPLADDDVSMGNNAYSPSNIWGDLF
jgi:hypothetical protein